MITDGELAVLIIRACSSRNLFVKHHVVQLNTLLWETPTNAKKKKKKAQTSEKPEAQLCDISFRVTEQILQSVCVRECVCVCERVCARACLRLCK